DGVGTGGAFDYWNDLSYGSFANNSEVFGWFQIPHDSKEILGLSRSVYKQWGFDAAQANQVNLTPFPRRIFFFNGNGDHGDCGGGTSVFAYAPGRSLEPTFMMHEMGHNLGFSHSFSDSPTGCCNSATPGEYCDQWDIMSAMCVFRFQGAFGTSGPGFNVPNLLTFWWLDNQRVWTNLSDSEVVELAPINRSDLQHFLAARLDYVDAASGQPGTYTVEYRVPDQWDRGLPYAAVLIHRIANGRSILVGSGRQNRPNLDWKVGDQFLDSVNDLSISVDGIDPSSLIATVRVARWLPQQIRGDRARGDGVARA